MITASGKGPSREVTGILSAIIIGAPGRLAVPGKRNIPIWLTLLIGVLAAIVGTRDARR